MAASVEDVVKKYDQEARFRNLGGIAARIVTLLAIGLSLFQLYTAGTGPLEALRQRSFHLMLILILAFLMYPAAKRSPKDRPSWLDWGLAGSAAVFVGYLFYNFDAFVMRNGVVLDWEYWIGAIGMLLVLEAARRVLGKELVIMAVAFLLYAYFGKYLPGLLGHRGYGVSRIIEHMYFGTEGLYGITLSVSATYMFLFILMGAFLGESGLSRLINDGAMAIAGRSPGGPAKVAVIATGFMGMLNGSAVANAASTGAFTIPVMKRAGYRAEFAAAVEGAGGTGGQIMPPIMGAAAFLIAEFLGISYGDIIIAAIIPAVLYYVSVWAMVHFEAKRVGLRGLEKHELPDLKGVLKEKGHLMIPVAVMIYLLVADYTALYAGYWAIISTLGISWLWDEGRAFLAAPSKGEHFRRGWYNLLPVLVGLGAFAAGQDPSLSAFLGLAVGFVIGLVAPRASEALKALRRTLESGARQAVGVAVATAVVGFVVGSTSLTSLGINIGSSIVSLADGNLLLALFLTMVTAIVVGTGIPTTPTYIIVVLVAAPALLKMGVPPLAAHLFVFYYGALADVTPPTALSSYAAAGIAGADPQKTTWLAWKLAMAGFIIPFYFATNPVLLLNVVEAPLWQIAVAVASALIGVISLSAGLQGYLLRPAGWAERGLFLVAALLLISSDLWSTLAGLAVLICAVGWQWVGRSRETARAA